MIRIKLKDDPQSYQWEIWDNKKVWTVCASDIEYVEFEHHSKTHEIESLESQLKTLKKELLKNNMKVSRMKKK